MIAVATVITGTTVAYSISHSRLRQTSKPSELPETAPVVQRVTALGRLEPASEVIKVSVPATLSNDRVDKLLVRRSVRVAAGQVIAIMDSRNRLQDSLAEAQEQVKVSQVNLEKVKAGAKLGQIVAQRAEILRLQKELEGQIAIQHATIARWQSEVRTANADYDRYVLLYKEGATSASDLDQKRLTLETNRAQLNEAEAEQERTVDTLRAQIEQARANLNQIAEVRPVDVLAAQVDIDKNISAVKKARSELADAYIRAPIAGRILDIYAKPGEVVGDKGIVDLGQTKLMQVVAEVYQTDISKIRKGQSAIITSESFPGQLHGTVRLVGLQVIKQEITSGEPGENLDRKVIEVRIQLNPEDSQRVASLTNLQVQVAIQPNPSSTKSQQTIQH